ncbi:hypothetical protein WG66_009442 [Moniliophthora roreri]|nr:hypothetical protein WG66_009442 [Moniliophthora roreri]
METGAMAGTFTKLGHGSKYPRSLFTSLQSLVLQRPSLFKI